MDGWRGTVVTTSIFTAAAVTDWLDGYIARKVPTLNFSYSLSFLLVHLTLEAFSVFNLTHLLKQTLLLAMQMKMKSTFGAFLDPVADKVIFFSFNFLSPI